MTSPIGLSVGSSPPSATACASRSSAPDPARKFARLAFPHRVSTICLFKHGNQASLLRDSKWLATYLIIWVFWRMIQWKKHGLQCPMHWSGGLEPIHRDKGIVHGTMIAARQLHISTYSSAILNCASASSNYSSLRLLLTPVWMSTTYVHLNPGGRYVI